MGSGEVLHKWTSVGGASWEIVQQGGERELVYSRDLGSGPTRQTLRLLANGGEGLSVLAAEIVRLKEERDALKADHEQGLEILAEYAAALSVLVNAPAPTNCSPDCRIPHLSEAAGKHFSEALASYSCLREQANAAPPTEALTPAGLHWLIGEVRMSACAELSDQDYEFLAQRLRRRTDIPSATFPGSPSVTPETRIFGTADAAKVEKWAAVYRALREEEQ